MLRRSFVPESIYLIGEYVLGSIGPSLWSVFFSFLFLSIESYSYITFFLDYIVSLVCIVVICPLLPPPFPHRKPNEPFFREMSRKFGLIDGGV